MRNRINRTRATGTVVLLALAACEGSSSSAPAASSSSQAETAAATAAAPSADVARALAGLAPEYRGTVGPDGAVVARLFYSAGRVTGMYFYTSVGATRKLAGPVTSTHFILDETVDGAKTATLTLDLSEGVVSGTWADAHGDKRSPVRLEPLPAAASATTALIFKRVAHAEKPAHEPKGKDDACKLSLSYAEVYGLPATVEAKIDADLAPPAALTLPEKCDRAVETTADYRVAYNADGILSVRMTSTVTDGAAPQPTHGGRAVTVLLATGLPVRLFGDVVKPKAERAFESALGAQVGALARLHNLDSNGRNALDQALAFSPPFVLEPSGVRLFADSLPPAYAAVGTEGALVRYATLPRPVGPVAVLWGK